jgi:DNA-binding transcriptional regulator YiaG
MKADAEWVRASLDELNVTPSELATLLGVTRRAVDQWLTSRRMISGPAQAYIMLLQRVPRQHRLEELAKLRGW